MPDYQSNYEMQPGAEASATARLCIVGTFCAFQYWLLTATMEAYHSGNTRMLLPAFIVSMVCFGLSAVLAIKGEYAVHRAAEGE